MKNNYSSCKKKILITGATGFIGLHLAEHLEKIGHQVFCLVRNFEKAKKLNVPGLLLQGDLKDTDHSSWVNALPIDLDVVIHTAGLAHSFGIKSFYHVNEKGTKCLWDTIVQRYKGPLQFIYISSLSAAGPCTLDEKKRIENRGKDRPVSHYGQSKLNAEKYLKKTLPKNIALDIIRPPMVIGPRDPAMLELFKLINKGVYLNIGKNASKREYSFICVHDLVQILSSLIVGPVKYGKSEIYYTSFPEVIHFQQLISTIAAQSNVSKLKKIYIPEKMLSLMAYGLKVGQTIFPIPPRLTPDKVPELLANKWICSGKKIQVKNNFQYRWDINKTIKITFENYFSNNSN